jgi:hypothetical protein
MEQTEAKFEEFTLAALESGLIDPQQKLNIDNAFKNTFTSLELLNDAKAAAVTALDGNNLLTGLAEDLEAKQVLAETDADALRTAADKAQEDAVAAAKADTAAFDANKAVSDFQILVTDYNTKAQVNPLIAELAPAEAGVETAQEKIDALTDAVADLKDAQKLVTDLGDLNKAIAAAEDAFTENDLELPVTLDSPTHDATEGSDIFVIGSDDSIITGFGLEGDDMLYVGSKYTLNMGDIEEDGNDSVLEMFLVQNGSDTEVTLEGKVFGSNSSDEEQTITLVGVSVEDVKFDNGLITV